jgi:glycosyltransferase involved in cell wall biosynthesis
MPMGIASAKPEILFVVTEDWYFCSHRLPLALAAMEAGFNVSVATRVSNHGDAIRKLGIEVYPWDMRRGSTGIFAELRALSGLIKIYRMARPDLVHHVALKPVLYGSFIAKFVGPRRIVNALGGMGSIFTAGSPRKRLLKTVILKVLKWLLAGKDKLLILQNPDDRSLMVSEAGVAERCIRLIRGAGVNLQQFDVSAEPDGVPLVVLPARMLWDKGIAEYVEAAGILKSEGIKARFALVGGVDECNPSGITRDQLDRWTAGGIVEWFGRREDMPEVLCTANIVCLPSYREGLPKALLEAAACARAIVATDVPGCREIVRDEQNGILVPARDGIALAAALKKLILAPDLRSRMGRKGRAIVIAEFSEKIVTDQTVAIYRELCAPADTRILARLNDDDPMVRVSELE